MNHNAFTQKNDIKNEIDYEESSVTDEVPIYFNILECGRNIFEQNLRDILTRVHSHPKRKIPYDSGGDSN